MLATSPSFKQNTTAALANAGLQKALARTRPQHPAKREAAVAGLPEFEALPLMLVRRKAFPNAFSDGLSVIEQKKRDPLAIAELLSIVDAVYTHGADIDHTSERKAS